MSEDSPKGAWQLYILKYKWYMPLLDHFLSSYRHRSSSEIFSSEYIDFGETVFPTIAIKNLQYSVTLNFCKVWNVC